jgi:hypothetical protein
MPLSDAFFFAIVGLGCVFAIRKLTQMLIAYRRCRVIPHRNTYEENRQSTLAHLHEAPRFQSGPKGFDAQSPDRRAHVASLTQRRRPS